MPWAPPARCAGGCGRQVRRGRCASCRRDYELARGRRQARGYDAEYEAERRTVLATATHCRRCRQPFTAANPPTAGHVIPASRGGRAIGNLGPEHASCNYAAGARS